MLKNVIITVALIIPIIGFYSWRAWYTSSPPDFLPIPEKFPTFKVQRLAENPIIHNELDPTLVREAQKIGYVNINGPCLIKVPEWVSNPLGKYYLYFSHHKGSNIRLAYADELSGPWTIYQPGVLNLENSYFVLETPKVSTFDTIKGLFTRLSSTEFWTLLRVGRDSYQADEERGEKGAGELHPYIANPDVYIDHKSQEIRMYFHGLVEDATQLSRVAVSPDGLNFTALPKLIAGPYFRVFKLRGLYYGVALTGLLYRSSDGLQDFDVRPKPLADANMRHLSFWVKGDILYLFWTRVGDAPEKILCSKINMFSNDWSHWKMTEPVEILRPELPWEGAGESIEPSVRGEAIRPVNQLRDPFIFHDEDSTYLLYSASGEQAIGIAELTMVN